MTLHATPPVRRFRNTKIIATLGPACSNIDAIRRLFAAGVDVFRMNLSHGSHKDHAANYQAIRAIEAELNRPIAVLLDLQGPKLRLGAFQNDRQTIRAGQSFRLKLGNELGDDTFGSVPHPEIFAAAKADDELLIDDGKLRLKIVSCDRDCIETRVLTSGVISNRKGINVPGALLPMSALTEKDHVDLEFGLALGVDWIALSFVQRPEDIIEVKKLVNGRAAVMAKLEKPTAIDSLEQIIAESDGVMIARGDLGVELPPETVPALQKRIIRASRNAGKPVVVATQMLESMVSAPVPTRAETSDVATAVYDGVDAVMLSAETASGQYPVEAVKIMDRVIRSVENDPLHRSTVRAIAPPQEHHSATEAICASMRSVSEILPLTATVAYTESGRTTLRVAHERPHAAILSLTPDHNIARRLSLIWGVHSVATGKITCLEDMIASATASAQQHGFSCPGEPFVIVAGAPFGVSGSTNLMQIVWAPLAEKRPEELAIPSKRMRDPYFRVVDLAC